MSKHYDLNGVSGNTELGKNGPRVKDESGTVAHRNSADSGYVVARGADPVIDDDLVTRRFYNANVPSGSITSRSVAFTNGSSFPLNIGAVIPNGAQILRTRISIGTAFTPATVLFEVGKSGTTNELMTSAQNNPQVTDTYVVENDDIILASDTQYIISSVGGAPTAGAGRVTIEYRQP
jgi:hypothetical protein